MKPNLSLTLADHRLMELVWQALQLGYVAD